jgi:predicted glycosyltransferase involved in capsule biosynthesis
MNIGIIMIFHNNADHIDSQALIQNIRSSENVEVCLVDNESKDNTLEKLLEIKDSSFNKVSVVEIKKLVTQKSAKRAGARYLFNNFNLKHIGFIDTNALIAKEYNINEVVKLLCNNKTTLMEFDNEIKRKNHIKPTLFKSIFSVLDYLRLTDLNQEKSRLKSTQ